MSLRPALLSLAVLTAPLAAQEELQEGQISRNNIDAVLGAQVEGAEGTPVEGAPANAGPPGNVDFDRLRQMIEESKQRQQVPPEQQKAAILQQLPIDRSAAGILAARLEEARAKDTPVPAKPENETPEQEIQRFQQQEAAVFRRDVLLGRWDKVREFLAALPPAAATPAYQSLVAKLAAPARVNPPRELLAQGAKPYQQPAWLPPAELLGCLAAAPTAPDPKLIVVLGKLLPKEPRPPQEFFDALTQGVRHFGGQDPADRRRAALLLLEAGHITEAGAFLPDLKEVREKKDYEGINLIARYRAELALHDKKAAGKDSLPLAWELSTSFLTDPQAPVPARGEALFRALSLIPELEGDAGRQWLEKTFQNPDGGGLELLASLGTLTAQSRENPDEKVRLEQLKLQHAAAQALTTRDGKGAGPSPWAGIFTLYARQWTYEAGVTRQKDQSNSRRMIPQYDEWGNMFYSRPQTGFQGPGTRPIGAGELLECRPDGGWLAAIEPATRNECLIAAANLLLKVKEENKALPLIKTLAATHRDEAVAMVRDVIRVWSENHNPNQEQDYRSRYFYFYGFNNQAGSIPLTRSKQERNLVELATLVKGIRELGLGESFHTELSDAFIACHSKAEVWRVDAIESVFGATDALDSTTLASLVGRMRLNLAGLWPNPKLQQAYQTQRKDKELQEQILHGYAAATGVLERALAKKPAGAWRLDEQLAALRYEESNYRSSLTPDNQHATIKRASLDELAAAAKAYTATLPLEDPTKESSGVFETWFYAAIGSPSLEALKAHHVPVPAEYAKIKAALAALPAGAKERNLKSFATTLNNRLANVPPDLKLRYLEAATAVVGDHEAMRDATDVLAYYRDLVKEIVLDASLDGPDRVGSAAPFGLRVNLRHTREIERESGGFQRYLQNQTSSPFAYNFGRPAEDYRDKFEKASRAILEEQFEVVSLTYHTEKVESRTDPEFGWRLTPYAYFLLKPKGPQVDRIPPLKIDLDFMDTSGYVVLPITSAEVPIDATTAAPRPSRELKVSQTLDERSHAEKGNLYLEIKASAHGLVPPLADLLERNVSGFEVGNIEDRGLRIVELDAASDDLAPVSEHEWRIELKPADGVLPASFHFPAVKPELAKEDGLVRQRYSDVDLLPVGADVPLTVSQRPLLPWLIAGALALAAIVGAVVFARRNRKSDGGAIELMPLPRHLNAVSLIGYLRRLQERPSLAPELRESIGREIAALEARYFGRQTAAQDTAELEAIARRWQAA